MAKQLLWEFVETNEQLENWYNDYQYVVGFKFYTSIEQFAEEVHGLVKLGDEWGRVTQVTPVEDTPLNNLLDEYYFDDDIAQLLEEFKSNDVAVMNLFGMFRGRGKTLEEAVELVRLACHIGKIGKTK